MGPFLLSKYLSILMDLKEHEGPLDGANLKSALVTQDTVCQIICIVVKGS